MQISALNDFAADPETVFAMLTDPAFLGEVCVAAGAIEHTTSYADGVARIERTLPAPEQVVALVGPTLRTQEELRWQPPAADGSRVGALTATVAGMPVAMNTEVTLGPGGRGTLVRYEGTFTINIPLLGRRLEAQGAPAMLEAIAVQQVEGDRRLQSM